MPVCVFPSVICQSQDLPGNVTLVLGIGEVANLGLCCKPKRMVTLQWLGWEIFCSLLALSLYICPNLLDHSHRVSLGSA